VLRVPLTLRYFVSDGAWRGRSRSSRAPEVGSARRRARLIAREGASVVVADINRTEAERVAAEIGGAVVAEVDVSDESERCSGWSRTAVEAFGGP
jgi:NAD(P)-dependent dehydrogenase (short-subunit alcohol dehydrogenase family)